MTAKGLYQARIIARETDLQILTDRPLDKIFCEERIYKYRRAIEDYIAKDRRFLTTLKPIPVELNALPIVKEMAKHAQKANVGPMATVAGAIAEFLGRDLLKKGYKDIIIENGGDIFLKTSKNRSVAVYAGRSGVWKRLRLKIKPLDTPIGICTSSGTFGHSLSFGCADCVVILSKNTVLADAIATATGNRVQSKKDLQSALDFAKSIKNVLGVVIIIKNHLISWGKVEFVH